MRAVQHGHQARVGMWYVTEKKAMTASWWVESVEDAVRLRAEGHASQLRLRRRCILEIVGDGCLNYWLSPIH